MSNEQRVVSVGISVCRFLLPFWCWGVLMLFVAVGQVQAQSVVVQRHDTLNTVVVRSQSASQRAIDIPIGLEKVDVETLGQLPALFGERDVIRGLQLLPGVKAEGDGL